METADSGGFGRSFPATKPTRISSERRFLGQTLA